MKRARVKQRASPAALPLFGGLALIARRRSPGGLSYYAQWGGMFGHLDDQAQVRLAATATECTNYVQQFIGSSVLPAYSPLLLWLGVVVTILGLFLSRWNRV